MIETNQLFASRLTFLRTQKGISQKELAKEVSNLLGDTISDITISSYECGYRFPPLPTLQALCVFFESSLDFLVGIDELIDVKRVSTPLREDDSPIEKPDLLINNKEWKKYHQNPVYVVAPGVPIRNRWGILDYEKQRVVFTDMFYPLEMGTKLYRMKPLESQMMDVSFKQPLTMTKLTNTKERVWVEMLNAEPVIRGQYSGWYRHNENHTCLINEANGLTLPYQGCCLSYNAYLV